MPTPSLSVRLPDDTRARLDDAAMKTHRSRSVLVQEALERYWSDLVTEQGSRKSRLERLRALKGAGARQYGPLSAEQIDADIGEFRGDE